MFTTLFKESKEIPYIPAQIVTADPQLGVHIDGNYVCCVNWLDYEFATVGNSYEIIFTWVVYGMKGFVFKTHHCFDSTLLDFLERCRAIRRYDGKADLIQLANFEYDVVLRECDYGYVVDKIEPQDDSYFCNVKAFYGEDTVFADLIKQAKNSTLIPHMKNRIALEFEHGTGTQKYYLGYLPIERLIDETFKYHMSTNTYGLSVAIAAVAGSGTNVLEEKYVHFILFSEKNSYPIRLKVDDFFLSLLARIGALKVEEGYSAIDLDALYKARFEMVFKRIGDEYQFFDLRVQSKEEEEYWEHLMQLAKTERESKEE